MGMNVASLLSSAFGRRRIGGSARLSRASFWMNHKSRELELFLARSTMMQTEQPTMQAAAIDGFGQPITPHIPPVPGIAPDEILIQVESAGVGVWDPFEREGGVAKIYWRKAKFPHVLRSDGAGNGI